MLLLWQLLQIFWPTALAALLAPIAYQPPELIKAALHVLEHYVTPRCSELVIMQLPDSNRVQPIDHYYTRRALSYLLRYMDGRAALQLLQDTTIEQPRDHILFLADTPNAFRGLHFNLATSQFDMDFKFVIVLTWRPESEDVLLLAIKHIFETCLHFHVLHAVVLVQPLASTNEVLIYGYRLFGPNCENMLTPVLLNCYKQGQLLNDVELLRRPLDSLYGCPLNVSWVAMPPYVMFDGNCEDVEQRQQIWRLSGIDAELLKLLSDIFEFRIELLPHCERRQLRKEHDNTCMKQLARGESMVAIGGLSASHARREQFSTTCSYHQSALVFVVRVERVMGAIRQLVQPFCGMVWLALICSCALILLLQWVRYSGHFNVTSSILHVHTTLLGNPVAAVALPGITFTRSCLGAWLLLALVLRAAYQGKLYDIFRLPYQHSIPEHITELLDANYMYLAAEYADYYPHNHTQLRQFNYEPRFQELESAKSGARLTTSALLSNLVHYNQLNWQTSRLTHVREHVYLYQLVMYMPHRCILKFAFDRKIKQLQSAGIVAYMSRSYENTLFHAPYKSFSTHEVTALNQEMFCGIYFVWTAMLIVAFIVFVLERLSLHFVWLRSRFT